MLSYEERFWKEREDYHEFAEEFERNVSLSHPDAVSSNRMCPFCYHCIWATTSVRYFEYNGESIK